MLKEIRYLESLEQQLNELEKQIKAYDKYIQSNVDENEEFGIISFYKAQIDLIYEELSLYDWYERSE